MEITYDISGWTQEQKDMLQSVFCEIAASRISFDDAFCNNDTGVCTVVNPSGPLTIPAGEILAQLIVDDNARAAANADPNAV